MNVKKTVVSVVKAIPVLLSAVIVGLIIAEYSETEIGKAFANLTVTSD